MEIFMNFKCLGVGYLSRLISFFGFSNLAFFNVYMHDCIVQRVGGWLLEGGGFEEKRPLLYIYIYFGY